jgi:predicted component of type VI protein secretion system
VAYLVLECAGERREIPVRGRVTIGRSRGCTVRVKDPRLSRENTSVTFDGRNYVVADLCSRNGTRLNGERLLDPRALKPGDKIKAGEALLTFVLDKDEASPAVPSKPAPDEKASPSAEAAGDRPGDKPAVAAATGGSTADAMAKAGPSTSLGTGLSTRARVWLTLLLFVLFGAGTYGFKALFTWALARMPAP